MLRTVGFRRLVVVLLALTAAAATLAAPAPRASAATAFPVWTCGFSNGLEAENSAASLQSGHASVHGRLLDLTGSPIDWAQGGDETFRLLEHSLKWVEPLITSGDPDDLARALAIVQDWDAQNDPANAVTGKDAWTAHGVGMRATTLACLALAAPGTPWLETALRRHADALRPRENYAGAWNHGIVQDIGWLATSCVLRDRHDRREAVKRSQESLAQEVDVQGATNEQSVGYARYVYQLLQTLVPELLACGRSAPSPLLERRELMPTFLAQATQPDGTYAPLGDTSGAPATDFVGTPAEYPATLGASGTPPADRVKVYDAGYVFGRSSWGTQARPFIDADFYSLRFGPERIIHGHNDHMSVTYFARRRPLVVDAGFGGYTTGVERSYVQSPDAHSVTTVVGARFDPYVGTSLLSSTSSSNVETYRLVDSAYPGVTRRRALAVAHDVPLMLTFDDSTSATVRTFRQLWHVDADLRVVRKRPEIVQLRSSDEKTQLMVASIPMPGQAPAAVSVVSGRASPYQGWQWTGPGPAKAAPVVTVDRRGRTQAQLCLVVATRPNAKIGWARTRLAPGVLQLRITVDGVSTTYVVSTAGGGTIVRR